ncbi:hypothetical protein E2562_016296 [Oryza meyeriana var. granulata]|uniref:Uncharacterized protein n=1 Tax=Oryza meyeriana var. granulata TaxID=110450 RepID=A0A6G1CSA4_9ORYZ|nr:hypothetical protein E2562_016296 [Oryza meyeriana var. granulata]
MKTIKRAEGEERERERTAPHADIAGEFTGDVPAGDTGSGNRPSCKAPARSLMPLAQRPLPRLCSKVGQSYQRACFTPLLLCWAPSTTFSPSLAPAILGVLPSHRTHLNLTFLPYSHPSLSDPMSASKPLVSLPAAMVVASYARVRSLI